MDEDQKTVMSMLSNTYAKLEGELFRLVREHDGAGDTGTMLPIDRKEWKKSGENGEIIVGLSLTVGFYGWTTTPVTEIIWVSADKTGAKVRTLNSVYKIESVKPEK